MAVHAHEARWKEIQFLTSGNKDIKHTKEILQLLEAANLPNQIALIHSPGHQKNGSQTSQRNETADKAARQGTRGMPLLGAGIPHLDLSEFKRHHTEQDDEWAVNGRFLIMTLIQYGR